MKTLDQHTFGDSKAEVVLADLLTQSGDINAIRYVSRFFVQATKHLKNISISNDGTRKYIYMTLHKKWMSDIDRSKLAEVHGKDSKIVSYFKNCLHKRLMKFLEGKA